MLPKIRAASNGFTLVEVVAVMLVIGILAAITYSYAVPRYRDRTYMVRGYSEMNTMANALTLYVSKYNDYPADVVRSVPPGIQEFLQQQYNGYWPNAPWPGSVYDYERWDDWTYHDAGEASGPIIQISVRMCDQGDNATCFANANKYLKGYVADSILAHWDSYSAVYYCIHGPCRSHQTQPANWPGYCINCGGKPQFN